MWRREVQRELTLAEAEAKIELGAECAVTEAI